jgi:hypothetical protein
MVDVWIASGEQAEQLAARHALQAVFAAGERRLQAERTPSAPGQGDHGEVDALHGGWQSSQPAGPAAATDGAGQDANSGVQPLVLMHTSR